MDYHWDVLEVVKVVPAGKDVRLFWMFNDNGAHHAFWFERLDIKNPKWEANSNMHGFRVEDFLSQHDEILSNFLALPVTELSCRGDSGGFSVQIKLDMKQKGPKALLLHNFRGQFDCDSKEVEALGYLLVNWNPSSKKIAK